MSYLRKMLSSLARLDPFGRRTSSLSELDMRLLRDIGFESRDALALALGIRVRRATPTHY